MTLRLEPVTPRRRFLWALVAWLALASSQPGCGPRGFGHTAFVCLAPWALVGCRPGRRAFLAEWLAASIGMALVFLWMRHLVAWFVIPLALVPSLYVALGGLALRRMAGRFPLAVAAPAAWTLAEMARWFLPPPFSFGWWRLGAFLHDTEWLAGSARVWGTWGLTWVAAAFGGWCADLWRTRGLALDQRPHFPFWLVHTLGVGPLALGMALTIAVPPPETTDGPRVLLVQPGIEQELKAHGPDRLALVAEMLRGTAEGLAASPEPVDLVCWGETMFPYKLVDPALRAAFDRGLRPPAFSTRLLDAPRLDEARAAQAALIEGALFGRPGGLTPDWRRRLAGWDPPAAALAPGGLLPAGTAFVTGIEELVERDGALRHRNAVALWAPDGSLAGVASKVHLVPAAEDPGVWVHLPLLPDLMYRVGGYVPDFVADPPGVLDLPRAGGAWRIGASVCYDQVFDGPFAARAGEVDLHLILSNEAWYGDSLEMDHMLAFARLDAIASGRSIVRATNSGISCVIDPSGTLLGAVEDAQGRRKMVRGNLSLRVPVPVGGRGRTPWARSHRWQPWAWVLLALALVWRGGYRRESGG